MTPENFCYWLQGFFEMTKSEELSPDQLKIIKEHLGYVFAGNPILVPSTFTVPMTQPGPVTSVSSSVVGSTDTAIC